MTKEEVIEKIVSLRRVTEVTGCITRRAQSEFLASLPNDLLVQVAPELARIFSEKEPNRHVNNTSHNSR